MKPANAGSRGDAARAATTDEVKQLRREAQDLKEVVAEQALELRLLKDDLDTLQRVGAVFEDRRMPILIAILTTIL